MEFLVVFIFGIRFLYLEGVCVKNVDYYRKDYKEIWFVEKKLILGGYFLEIRFSVVLEKRMFYGVVV